MIAKSLFICFGIVAVGALLSCDELADGQINSSKVKEELKSRKIARLTEGQILEAALEKGNAITGEAQKALVSALKRAINDSGFVYALEYCNINAMQITDSIQSNFNIKIKRVGTKVRNKNNIASEQEQLYLEGYEYAHENGSELLPNVQLIGQNQIFFTNPIVIADPVCLSCHGDRNTDMKSELIQKLGELYSNDQATGYKMGDLRGMWAIQFDKRELIKNMNLKK